MTQLSPLSSHPTSAPDVASYAADCARAGLRGDYRACRPDFTVPQDYAAYSATDHKVWRLLAARQTQAVRRYAHPAYLKALDGMSIGERIPDVDAVSDELYAATGWSLVPVPGLIPDHAFFAHLAARRFPVTNWIRAVDELDYIVEPDLFHDFFGHVPILTQPAFADFMQAYGETALDAMARGVLDKLTRLYWFTAEFGLIQEPGAPMKAFGAGLLSSFGELRHAVAAPGVTRRPLDVATVIATPYEIDRYQRQYFVLRAFAQLSACLDRFAGLTAADR